MRNIYCCVIIMFFAAASFLYSSGKQEEKEIKEQNDEWVLCITEIETRELPQGAHIAHIISKMMTDRINEVSRRTRISDEYAYYEEKAWTAERASAARDLTAKLNERSSLVFRGEPEWRYRRNLSAIDVQIAELRAKLEAIENNAPLISREPVFKLSGINLGYTFPAAPAEKAESKFCADQKADAFLSLSMADFYGRLLFSVRLYTAYTKSYSWEDFIVFSFDDIENAVNEITRRLIIALSGEKPAQVSIRAEPEDALLLINSSFAGRAEINARDFPPGVISIAASSPDYESLSFETEIFAGEIINITISLNPVEYGTAEISSDLQGSVYHGALYMGETPLTLRLPVNRMEYIEFETPDLNKTAVVFQMPEKPDQTLSLSLFTIIPRESGGVERDRSWYYWTWGGTWITGIAAWIAYYSYSSIDFTVRHGQNVTAGFYDDYRAMFNVSAVTIAVAGAAAGYGIYRLVRYILSADRTAAPIVKTGRD